MSRVVGPSIGILGHVGNQNLGDEAIFAAVIENIQARAPHSAIYGFTIHPEDTRRRFGIPAFPIRQQAAPAPGPERALSIVSIRKQMPLPVRRIGRLIIRFFRIISHAAREAGFWVESYRRLRGLDLLIVAGSQQLNDFVGGPWAFPYTLFKWSCLARLRGVRLVFASVGAGPIRSALGRWFIRRALSNAAYRSYRDEASYQLIAGEMRVPGEHRQVPDLVFSLSIRPRITKPGGTRPLVAINPLPLFHSGYWHESTAGGYEGYVRTLAGFADWLVERGYNVALFPTQLRVDPCAIRDVRLAMRAPGEYVRQPEVASFDDLLAALAPARFVVATRYHAILLSLAMEKPVLALAYHIKSEQLMSLAGQEPYAVTPEDGTLAVLQDRFMALEAQRSAAVATIVQCLPALRRRLKAQYDHLLGAFTTRHDNIPVYEVLKSQSG